MRVTLSWLDRSSALFDSRRILVSTLPRLPVSNRMARLIWESWRWVSVAALRALRSAASSLDVSPPKRMVSPL